MLTGTTRPRRVDCLDHLTSTPPPGPIAPGPLPLPGMPHGAGVNALPGGPPGIRGTRSLRESATLSLRACATLALVLAAAAALYAVESESPVSVALSLAGRTQLHGVRIMSPSVRDGASLVWVLLGETHFQPYVLESIVQARLFNRDAPFFLVVDPTLAHAAGWDEQLDSLRVERVDPKEIEDSFGRDFSAAFSLLWDFHLREHPLMAPIYNDQRNLKFTLYTSARLVTLFQLMASRSLRNIIHIENDQMLYGPIQALADAANVCGVRLAMARINADMLTASVLYASSAGDLKDMLDFFLESITQGPEHAFQIARSTYVTDMSLSAAYFNHAQLNPNTARAVQSLPNVNGDSCLEAQSGFIFDALALSQWCCGDFYGPSQYFSYKLGFSQVRYWDAPFEWHLIAVPPGRLRVPVWNGSRAFNLHMHSKQLHLWRSTDSNVSLRWPLS